MNAFEQKGPNNTQNPGQSNQNNFQNSNNNNFQNNSGRGGYDNRNGGGRGGHNGNNFNNASPGNRNNPPYQQNNQYNQQQQYQHGQNRGGFQGGNQGFGAQGVPPAGQPQTGFPTQTPNLIAGAGGSAPNFGQQAPQAQPVPHTQPVTGQTVPPMTQGIQGPGGVSIQGQMQTPVDATKTTRWGQAVQAPEIQQFVTMYMPWVVEQRRRAQQEAGFGRQHDLGQFGMGGSLGGCNIVKEEPESATNLLKQDDNKNIEQSQQYKQLLRYNPAAAAAMKSGVKCPERLAIYIERAFSKCISDMEREFMREQLEQICTTSKNRGDFFIKQWELMPLPCLQRESTSFQAMNDRLIRGDQNTSVPFPEQFSMQPGGNGGGPTQGYNPGSGAMGQGTPGNGRFGSGGHPGMSPGSSGLNQNQFKPSVSPFSSSLSNNLGAAAPQSDAFRGRNANPYSKQMLPGSRDNSTAARGGQLQHAQNFSGFASRQQAADMKNTSTAADVEMFKRLKRLEKFDQQLQAKAKQSKPEPVPASGGKYGKPDNGVAFSEEDANMGLDELAKHMGIRGQCQIIEKSYFRLTSAPDPSEVRPEPVLHEALSMLISKWEKKRADYKYIDDQFRSLRQDLTVQRIQNDFCVKVYEAHARIALEEADLDQFNQCQTQLRYLYQLGYKGNRTEFLAYQLLYYVLFELETDTLRMMKTLTVEEKKQEPVAHALKVRNALAQGNYGRFFKLYRVAPNKGMSLIDVFVDKIRIMCLQKLAIGFVATNIDMNYLSLLLAFDTVEHCTKFLTDRGCVFIKDGSKASRLDCKASLVHLKKAPMKLRRCKK